MKRWMLQSPSSLGLPRPSLLVSHKKIKIHTCVGRDNIGPRRHGSLVSRDGVTRGQEREREKRAAKMKFLPIMYF